MVQHNTFIDHLAMMHETHPLLRKSEKPHQNVEEDNHIHNYKNKQNVRIKSVANCAALGISLSPWFAFAQKVLKEV